MNGLIKEIADVELHIERINSDEAYQFILKRHYAKRIPSISFAFGLFKGSEIVGIMTIGKPASPSLCVGVCGEENSSRVYELNRLFLEDDLPKNTASYFMSRCLGYLRPPPHSHGGYIIVSYADTKMNHCGYIYQATNWIYTGLSSRNFDYIDPDSNKHSRHMSKNDANVERVERSRKHRYIFFIGDRIFKRRMKAKLNYKIEPYPKLDPKHYDTGKCEKQLYFINN